MDNNKLNKLNEDSLEMVTGGGRVTASLPDIKLFTSNDETQNKNDANNTVQKQNTSRPMILKA